MGTSSERIDGVGEAEPGRVSALFFIGGSSQMQIQILICPNIIYRQITCLEKSFDP